MWKLRPFLWHKFLPKGMHIEGTQNLTGGCGNFCVVHANVVLDCFVWRLSSSIVVVVVVVVGRHRPWWNWNNNNKYQIRTKPQWLLLEHVSRFNFPPFSKVEHAPKASVVLCDKKRVGFFEYTLLARLDTCLPPKKEEANANGVFLGKSNVQRGFSIIYWIPKKSLYLDDEQKNIHFWERFLPPPPPPPTNNTMNSTLL